MTNINNITGPYEQKAYMTEPADKKQQVRAEQDALLNKKEVNEDRVSLSEGSREMSLAKQAAMEDTGNAAVPYDRAGKVAEIKQEVESGQYQTDSDQAAEKIIGLVIDEVV
jgi:anti-sigma28 factor (negative regulator of flagellin synthesis)